MKNRERKRGGTVVATMTINRIVNDEDNEFIVTVQGYFNPAQHGGEIDPSWNAYIDYEDACNDAGERVILTKDEEDKALEALWEAA